MTPARDIPSIEAVVMPELFLTHVPPAFCERYTPSPVPA